MKEEEDMDRPTAVSSAFRMQSLQGTPFLRGIADRCRILHDNLCRLVGLGGGGRAVPTAEAMRERLRNEVVEEEPDAKPDVYDPKPVGHLSGLCGEAGADGGDSFWDVR